eukprot:TRINITY_DN18226_c0_g1_i1.p1 TRINITY_DN18226_c0_g1~~TRINITY_DN18226_c0_g1_i1.p1  ORF type:complete len:113 (+),score=8.48 TRINITY_DN18226_c0_g1_i1:195-533(+)
MKLAVTVKHTVSDSAHTVDRFCCCSVDLEYTISIRWFCFIMEDKRHKAIILLGRQSPAAAEKRSKTSSPVPYPLGERAFTSLANASSFPLLPGEEPPIDMRIPMSKLIQFHQ